MTTSQAFLQSHGQFQHLGCVDGDVTIDPRLGSISSSNDLVQDMSVTMATQQAMHPNLWNSPMDSQMVFFDNQLGAPIRTEEEIEEEEILDQRKASNATTTSSNADRTRSSSPLNSSRSARKRSATSSRSSVPSVNSAPSEKVQKARKSKAPTTRSRKQSTSSAGTKQQQQQQQISEPELEEFEEDDSKRNRFLERNRIAASKCRQKKKEWVHDLEETKHELESRNSSLHMEHNALVAELTKMKNALMSHANCRNINIDQWIENEARRFVQNATGRFDGLGAPGAVLCAPSYSRNGKLMSIMDLFSQTFNLNPY